MNPNLKINLSPDAADGAGAPPDVAVLQKENAELREQLAAVKKPGALSPEQEKIVREKMRAGLTREQAISVLQAQEEWDAAQATSVAATAAGAAKVGTTGKAGK